MQKGKTLQELATEIARQHESKRDFLVPTNQLVFSAIGDEIMLDFPTLEPNMLRVNGIAHEQFGQFCGIPKRYYDTLLSPENLHLLATNVQWWLDRGSDRRMIRTLDGTTRAFLSDKYRRLDNYDLAQAILPILSDAGVVIKSSEITERRLYIQAVTPKVEGEVAVGDVVQAGVIVTNSEVGHGSLSVRPLIYRLVCSNGMIVDDYARRKYHVGRQLDTIEFTDETKIAEDRAFWLQTRDLVSHCLSEAMFQKILSDMKLATSRKIEDPTRAIELAKSAFSLSEQEKNGVLAHLIQGGDLSSYGLGNAVTRLAHDVETYDRSVELESIGYKVMERSWN